MFVSETSSKASRVHPDGVRAPKQSVSGTKPDVPKLDAPHDGVVAYQACDGRNDPEGHYVHRTPSDDAEEERASALIEKCRKK